MRTPFPIALWLFFASSLHGANWYLDIAAAGSNNGTSWANAWPTYASINWGSIVSGDTLWIQGGEYNDGFGIFDENGVTARIATNATTKAVFTNGQLYNADNCLLDGWLNNTQYIRFRGIANVVGFLIRESTNTTMRGIEVDRSDVYTNDVQQYHCLALGTGNNDRLIIDRCHLHHTSGDGININFTPPERDAYDAAIVTGCLITDVGDDGMQAGCGHITLEGNYVNQNGFLTLFGGHPDGIQTTIRGNFLIRNNVFRGFNQNIFVDEAVSNVFIYNNILIGLRTNSTDRGMIISKSTTTNFIGTWITANNTFYNFLSYFAMVTGPGLSIRNNLYVNCKLIMSFDSASMDSSNIYWDYPGVQYYNSNGDPVATPSDRLVGASLNVNPWLVSPVGDNFHLLSNSLAIGAGANLSSIFTNDYDGVIRHTAGAWDVGAFQFETNAPNELPNVGGQFRSRKSPISSMRRR